MNELNPSPATPSVPAGDTGRCGPGRHGHRRGGLFKGLFAGAILFAIVAGGAYIGSSHAFPGAGGRHAAWLGSIDPEAAGKRIDALVSFVLADTDATADQKAKIGDIARGALQDLLPLRAEHQAARASAIGLLAAPNIDRAALEQLRAAEFRLADTASKRVTQAIADAAETLQPAQRAKLADKMKQRMERHG